MGKFLQTAQFARLCDVSKQTLIYYHRIGLFLPHHTDHRGFRYYDISQVESFQNISLLVELDTPLGEIKTYLQSKSSQAFLDLMAVKRKSLEEKIRGLERVKRRMDRGTAQVAAAMEVDAGEIRLETLGEERFNVTRPLRDQSDEEFIRALKESERSFDGKGGWIFGSGALVNIKRFLETGEYWVDRVTFRSYEADEAPAEESWRKPEGLYLIGHHRGSFDTIEDSYERLFNYLREKGLRVRGDGYEDVLLDSFTQVEEEQFLIRISIALE